MGTGNPATAIVIPMVSTTVPVMLAGTVARRRRWKSTRLLIPQLLGNAFELGLNGLIDGSVFRIHNATARSNGRIGHEAHIAQRGKIGNQSFQAGALRLQAGRVHPDGHLATSVDQPQ